MDLLWKLLISNAMIAGCLFVMVLLVRRWVKNPAVLHLLLLLVLIKLITPAVWYPRIDLLSANTETATNHPETGASQRAETESTHESQTAARSGLSPFDALRKGLRNTTTAAVPPSEAIPPSGTTTARPR